MAGRSQDAPPVKREPQLKAVASHPDVRAHAHEDLLPLLCVKRSGQQARRLSKRDRRLDVDAALMPRDAQ
jgi:hypothetical protein